MLSQKILAEAKILAVKSTAQKPKPTGIQSVDRALTLLELLAEATDDLSLNKLSELSGLNVSTCHHLLATLAARGFVAKRPGRRYGVGSRALVFSQAYTRQVDLARVASPILDQLNVSTRETVHLAALHRGDLVMLAQRDALHAVRVDSGLVGATDAAHATATGKAILAWLPEPEIRRMLDVNGMRRFTEKTITDGETLLEHLRLVRRNGYSLDEEEFQPHVICIGAAIRNHSGGVIGAISASTPTTRASPEHRAFVRREVVAAARSLSEELGEPQGGVAGHP